MCKLNFCSKILFLFFLIPRIGFSQFYEKEQQQTFSYGNSNPIQIEVETNNERFIFKAINSSYYPYTVNVEYNQMINLLPYITKETYVVYPGVSRLRDFTKKDPNQSHYYSYKYSVKIGDPSKNPEENFPYLLPLSINKKIEIEKKQLDNSLIFITNNLKVQKGDSVFCIRKGQVTALGNSRQRENVVMSNSSVEIRHIDGTVAVYQGIDLNSIQVRLGQMVFPEQFFGVADDRNFISVSLYSIKGDGYLRQIQIKYIVEDSLKILRDLEGEYVEKSELIVEKEMTRREKRLNSNGKLYN
ncbi:hypothetical protein CYCD_22380 [Tenuifilaceae bacterium CYCD]|nr:hypothetical protein CYCD_22380 [Tenuifilaceae bacterium CYCD]